MAKLQTQLHTIISQETIKPSSPTPPHLKTHNLSLLDQFAPDMHTPFVFFFPNYKNGDTNILKQSLSQSLTHYNPFAGRFPTPPEPYINCNDEGVDFLEASIDTSLDDFICKNVQDESIDQLFPYGLSYSIRASSPTLLEVQLSHFNGGGAAVAISMSHKLADGATIFNFINHWANFIVKDMDKVNYATRRFVFLNSKLNEVKNKVIAMGTCPVKPTRVEVVTSLLFKHAVSAATKKSGTLKPSNLTVTVNLRSKFVEKYPETTASNLFTLVIAKMAGWSEIRLSEVIAEVRKGKMELEGIRDEKEVVEKLTNGFSNIRGDIYYSSSLCRVPFYDVDFGWGKPVEVTMRIPNVEENTLILMDTPCGDGITAFVHLPEEEMAILLKDE
ncbi:hypothetical protein LXL04_024852 [Taraxacum kok-saghyz]